MVVHRRIFLPLRFSPPRAMRVWGLECATTITAALDCRRSPPSTLYACQHICAGLARRCLRLGLGGSPTLTGFGQAVSVPAAQILAFKSAAYTVPPPGHRPYCNGLYAQKASVPAYSFFVGFPAIVACGPSSKSDVAMRGVELLIINGTTQFVIPVFQRPRYLCRAAWEFPFLACAWV
jgi:hypothetical protein